MEITPQITIEELVEKYPASVKILRDHGLVCIICGEPVWGTLQQLAEYKGLDDEIIARIIDEIRLAE
jgi:methionine synthase II (cobalamin-independent)